MYEFIDYEIIDELKNYADIEGSELGDLCKYLCSFFEYNLYEYCLNEKFVKSMWNEILDQLNNFKENTKIIEDTYVQSIKTKTLEWI